MEQDGRDGDLESRCQYGEKHPSLAQITELISVRWRVAIFGLFGVGRLGRPPIYDVALACTSTDNARAIDTRYDIVSLYSFAYAPLSLSDLAVYDSLLLFFCVSMQRQMPSKWLWFQRP